MAAEQAFMRPDVPEGCAEAPQNLLAAMVRGLAYIVAAIVAIAVGLIIARVLIALSLSVVAGFRSAGFGREVVRDTALVFAHSVRELWWLENRGGANSWISFVAFFGVIFGVLILLRFSVDIAQAAGALVLGAGAGALMGGVQVHSQLGERVAAWLSHPLHRGRAIAARLGGLVLYAGVLDLVARYGHLESIRLVVPPTPLAGPPSALELMRDPLATSHGAQFGVLQGFWQLLGVGTCVLVLVAVIVLVVSDVRALINLVRARGYDVVAWARPDRTGIVGTIRIAHFSDLHLGVSDDARRAEAGLAGNAMYRRLLHERAEELRSCDAIVITGDVTDTGDDEEWQRFLELSKSFLDRMYVLPGNHDLNIVHPTARLALEPASGRPRACRQVRMLAAMDLLHGDRSHVCSTSLRERLAASAAELRGFYETGEKVATVTGVWNELFPISVTLPGGFVIHMIDSNDVTGNMASNAFGRVPASVLERLAAQIAQFSGQGHIVGLHHHLAFHPLVHEDGVVERLKTRFMVLQNARELVAALGTLASTVVLHGHRHLPYEGSIDGRIDVVSAPSTTLGDVRGDEQPGFRVLEIGRWPNGSTRLLNSTWHSASGA